MISRFIDAITSAMKIPQALKKAQDITAMRPYAEKLTELLQNLSATLEMGGEVYNAT
jgi:F-type H+-transporting ATPase subunit gamma